VERQRQLLAKRRVALRWHRRADGVGLPADV
jgi:hypothetical protein